MPAFCLICWGAIVFYARSKYAPDFLDIFIVRFRIGIGILLLAAGAGFCVKENGWASGLVLFFCTWSLCACIIPFLSVVGKRWLYSFLIAVHALLLGVLYAG